MEDFWASLSSGHERTMAAVVGCTISEQDQTSQQSTTNTISMIPPIHDEQLAIESY